MSEKITFKTEDDVMIVGNYTHADDAVGAVLLLHMMPATRESWDEFAVLLANKGLSSLAIDLRGHGESFHRGGETLDYKLFEDRDHQDSRLDVDAAVEWLLQKEGISEDRLAVAGASIGSNLAIRVTAERPRILACVALSPGLDYHGVMTEDAVGAMKPGQHLLLAVSDEDELSFKSVQQLEAVGTGADRTAKYLSGVGHGTTMFERDPAFMRETLEWLVAKF